MTKPALQLPNPLPQALQGAPDDSNRPVVVLVLDPQQRLLSWRHLTLAEVAAVIAMHENPTPELTNG